MLWQLCAVLKLCSQPVHDLLQHSPLSQTVLLPDVSIMSPTPRSPHCAGSSMESLPLSPAFAALYNLAMPHTSKRWPPGSQMVSRSLLSLHIALPTCPRFPAAVHPIQMPGARCSPIFQDFWPHDLHGPLSSQATQLSPLPDGPTQMHLSFFHFSYVP